MTFAVYEGLLSPIHLLVLFIFVAGVAGFSIGLVFLLSGGPSLPANSQATRPASRRRLVGGALCALSAGVLVVLVVGILVAVGNQGSRGFHGDKPPPISLTVSGSPNKYVVQIKNESNEMLMGVRIVGNRNSPTPAAPRPKESLGYSIGELKPHESLQLSDWKWNVRVGDQYEVTALGWQQLIYDWKVLGIRGSE